ncbi:MAG TPA: BMP family ABC transporter substrate-binding protein [Chloroflexi bacterium]|nr:BMP family ABC transporter substrate-binding protein [Chloroflexota bacterium]
MLSLVACGGGAAPAEEEAAPAEEEAAPAEEEAAPAEEEAAPAEEEAAEEEAAGEEAAEEEAAGRLALVLPGPLDDNSWNEAAYIALQALGEQGVDTAFSENISDADAERILRTYADEGYEMVIGHSFGFQDAVFAVAEDYPDINFAWAGGIGRTAANVADYDQPFYEAAYAIGVLAGYMSESGVLGAMYGFDIPVCHAMGEAFLLGAQTVNPDAQLIQTAVGDWVDVAKAKEAALAQADAGVDFWIECGEGPALGTIEAAKEAGGYVTGYVGDMTENGPDVVLVNLIWNLEPLFAQMLEDTHNGTFDNPFYRFGVAEGAMLVEYNEALMDQIPQEAIDAVAETMDGIAAGEIEVPFIPESSE